LPSCEDILLELEHRKKDKNFSNLNAATVGEFSTPLLEFLKQKKGEKKLKEVINFLFLK
jgi:hypothetical protein